MSVIHSGNYRYCWNCTYWDPIKRIKKSNGDVEEWGDGTCKCPGGSYYGQKKGNMGSCSRFLIWKGQYLQKFFVLQKRDNMSKEAIREFSGKIIGFREDKGSQIVATDFYGRQLGYYDKSRNETRDFYGRIICSGDATTSLILNAKR